LRETDISDSDNGKLTASVRLVVRKLSSNETLIRYVINFNGVQTNHEVLSIPLAMKGIKTEVSESE
jgi:hypothetical protein